MAHLTEHRGRDPTSFNAVAGSQRSCILPLESVSTGSGVLWALVQDPYVVKLSALGNADGSCPHTNVMNDELRRYFILRS